MLSAMLAAFSWDPQFRGILFVSLMVVATMGGSYVILSTNVGVRLGALLTFTAIFGWCVVMGMVWWVFGIGLMGQAPTWVQKAYTTGDLTEMPYDFARTIDDPQWRKLPTDDKGYGQATASADSILLNEAKAFTSSGEYKAISVYKKGGERYPKVGKFDLFAFFHKPNYAIVQVQPVIIENTEPGKAPPTPVLDESKKPTYVLMERDLGYLRLPAAAFTIGSLALFLVFANALHRRDKLSMQRTGKLPALTTGA
jgi:hypothetical protein